MANSILIKNGTLVTMDASRSILSTDLKISGNQIVEIGPNLPATEGAEVIDASNHFVIPGLIQAHTHLVQCLFRGLADDMKLLDWLQTRIWPLEAHHDSESIYASAKLALTEMQLLGTTSVLDMATVKNTDHVLKAVDESGMRYWGGKCLMDLKESSGPLYEDIETTLVETESLINKWHRRTELINYALCPRFAISCSDELLKACAKLQSQHGIFIHTHASESREEIEIIKDRTGLSNVEYLKSLGFLNSKTVLVHGVHLKDSELESMIETETSLVHCPSSNLKLASGIGPMEKYRMRGLNIALGSDGAPCNNTMDPFMEMRLAALIQKPEFGPEAMPARAAFEMATINGARALAMEDKIGSLEVGKLADVVVVDRSHPSVATVKDPYSALVYSCSGRDVRHVFIHGQCIVKDKNHQRWNSQDVVTAARIQLEELVVRAEIDLS